MEKAATAQGNEIRAMIQGAVGFGMVSLAAFSIWALEGRSLQRRFGEAGLYTACAVVFLVLSGLLLRILVKGPSPLARFYAIFIPAFLAYAVTWCVAWFLFKFGLGEWLGSLMGSAAFVLVAGWRFGSYQNAFKAFVILALLHSAGYFLGGLSMSWIAGLKSSSPSGWSKNQIQVIAKLSWGLLYGLGFGAGIGYAFCTFQSKRTSSVSRGS